jgi:hypothetical protein
VAASFGGFFQSVPANKNPILEVVAPTGPELQVMQFRIMTAPLHQLSVPAALNDFSVG